MFVLLLSIVCFNKVFALPRVDPLVIIDQGLVRGQKSADNQYSTFFGVPYASVDLENPFGTPLSAPSFGDTIFNANDDSIKCPQQALDLGTQIEDDEHQTLDCLRLNIYVPNIASSNNPLPVFVWIHGGAFALGYAGGQDGKYFMKQNIIVVTVNYRLGPYGFLCLDVPQVPGNQGLKDQNEALVWIKKNIAAFGGNPYNVTIGGQSAGSMSVVHHLYSSKEKLYSKVILESGTPFVAGAFINGDVDAAIKLAEYLGFNTTDTEEALEFLTNTPHKLVTGAATSLGLLFRPCKERSFSGVENLIDSDPYSMSNFKKIRNTPILIGHTDQEVTDLLTNTNFYGDDYFNKDPFRARIEKNFNLDDEQLEIASNIVRHFYIGDKTASRDLVEEIEIFESDFIYIHPIERTITNLLNENANPVYEYVFSYTGNTGLNGAGHSEELKYLFDAFNTSGEKSEEDELIIDRITTLWANFIKYGNPTPEETDLLPVTWKPLTTETRPYLVIDTNIRLDNRVYKERMAFWDLFYDIYGKYNNLIRECMR